MTNWNFVNQMRIYDVKENDVFINYVTWFSGNM